MNNIVPIPKCNSWFTYQVIGTRHTYKLWRKDGGPKCEKWLGVILKLKLKFNIRK
jgi:hypothetical protein